MDNNYTNTGNFDQDYVKMKDGSYKSRQELINDSNTVKIDGNKGVFGTAVDQLGNDLGVMGGGLLGLAGSDSALQKSQSNMLANQYIDSQKDYGDFSGSGLLNLGVRNIPLMIGSLGAGALARKGTQSVVEGLLKSEMTKFAEKTAFNTGLGVAGGLQNLGYNNADKYNTTGEQLTTNQGLASFGSGAILNAIEGNALLGNFGKLAETNGLNLATRGANALKTGVSAGGINVVQDAINRQTLDRDLTSDEALSSYARSFGTGVVVGAPFGAINGSFKSRTPEQQLSNQNTTQPVVDTPISQDIALPEQTPLLQLGYDPNAGRQVMYGTDNGILGNDINAVTDQRINDYLSSGNQERVDANESQPSLLDSQNIINESNVSQDLANNTPKSREELMQRIIDRESFKNQEDIVDTIDTTPMERVQEETKTIGSPGLAKILKEKYGTTDSNLIALKKREELLKRSQNPSFEDDIRTITGDNSLFKNGELTFTNKELAKPVEIAIKNHANDLRSGDAVAKVDTTPVTLDDNVKEVATKNIKTPKIKNDFIKLNEKVLENPSPEKVALLNNVKNEIEKSNVSDSAKLINTISKVADNLTEKTAKEINDSFVNKGIDEDYVKEIQKMAIAKRAETNIQLDQAKQETFNKLISNETENFKNYDSALTQQTPSIDKNGVETYSLKDGNSTIEKIVDKSNDTTQYLRDGQLHNEFGPALIEGKNKEYYLFDEQLSKKEWREQLNEMNSSRPELDAVKKNENKTRLKANVLTDYLKQLIDNNQLSDAVELKKKNIPLNTKEQARIDSLNNSLNDIRGKVNVDMEVISPYHDIGNDIGENVYGWFDSEKNKIYIVGHSNIKETLATVLRHELYHKGISVYLKGVEREQFTRELDKLYQNKLVKDMTDNIMKDPNYANDKYVAIEEALSNIVQNENNIIQNPSMFNRLFDYIKNFLNKLLGVDSFTSNKEVRDFLNKTQKLALTPEEVAPIKTKFENVIRFSREIRSDDQTRLSLQDVFRNQKYNNQVDRQNMNTAERLYNDARDGLNSESDTNLTPYANPLGTKYFSNKFNGTINKLMQWTMKQDHLLGFHGKVGQSLLNIINSTNTFKGDATARLEAESSKLFQFDKKLNEVEKGKIFEVLGRYSYEVQNSKDSRAIGERLDSSTLERELKNSGLQGQKLKDAIEYSNEVRNVADYAIHISKMNDSVAMWETIKKTINGYDEMFGDKIDTLITQSFRNQFEKNGTTLTPDTLSIRNFNENFEKVLKDSGILNNVRSIIDQKTREIEADRQAKLSVDVSNMTKGEYEIFARDINAEADAKLNSIPEKQHLDNINFVVDKLNEYQNEAITREDRGYIHKDMSGRYFLTVKTMVNGKEVKYTLASDDMNEISKIQKQIKDQFGDTVSVNSGTRQSVNPKDLVNSLLSLEAYGGELSTDQMNLLTVLEGYGDKIKRQYTGPGYEQNLTKVLADYSYNKINQMSSKHKMADIGMLLNSIDGPNKVSVKAQLTDILQTMTENRTIPQDTVGSKIRGVTSIWALGANISNTVAQVFQTGMIAPNYFRKYNGETSWRKSLFEAHKFLENKQTGNKELDSLLSRIENNDLLSASMAKSMFEAKENPLGKSTFERIKEKAYFLNEYTERRLRYATVMEAFKIYKAEETKKSQGKPYDESVLNQNVDDFVLNSIRTVNGDFSKQNRAKLYQNDLVATLMMFQDWKSVTFNAFRQMDKASQIKFALQHSVLMGGILGVPFGDDLVELIDSFFKFFGVQPPVRKLIEKTANSLDENIIAGAGDYFKHGIPLIGEKIGLGQIIPNLQGATELLTGDKNKGLKGLLGPSGNLITNLAGGVQQVGSGLGQLAESGGSRGYESLGRGFINMSPGVLKSFEKGLEVGVTGQLESADGSVKMYDVNRLYGILVAGNFRTPGMADTLDEYNVLKEYKVVQNNKMKQYKDAYLDAYRNKDFKEMAEVTQLAKSINPSFNGKDVIKNDKTSISMKERFVKSLPKDSQTEYNNLL